jgi:hypothetical protein
MPELDCPAGKDPQQQTVDERRAAGQTPLWAERMNLAGSKQGPQSRTIYSYREEYKPSQKTEARSMVGGEARMLRHAMPGVQSQLAARSGATRT